MTTNHPPGPRTRPLLIAASIPSVLSLAWTAWSVADMIPAPWPVAIAAGIALDVALVAAVAIAWVAPSIARGAQTASWLIAGVAAAAIAIHSWSISPALALMAAVPLISKALWHLALSAKAAGEAAAAEASARAAEAAETERREADRKERRLSVGLTEDQEAELAELERQRAYTEAKAAKALALAEAQAKAAQEERLAEIRRRAQTQMATDEATAQIHVKRAELAQQIQLASPVYSVAELPTGGGQQAPDDPSGFGIPPVSPVAGFGAGLSEARSWGGGIVRHPGGTAPDLVGRPSPDASGGGIGHQSGGTGDDQAERAPHHAARVAVGRDTRQRVLAEIGYAGVEVSNAELSRLLGIGRTTVRDHRNALRDAGHRVYPDSE